MINATDILWEYLTTSGTSLYTLVEKQIWSPEAITGWANDTRAVLFDFDTQVLQVNSGHVDAMVQFYCYGATDKYDDADAVYFALNDRLHAATGERTASGVILRAELLVGLPGQREQESEWPVARALYDIKLAS